MKRKSFGKCKLSIIIIVALTLNSFAAIVSDNDGSAFVTKSEFDALRKDFSQQIENYSDSIESKVDGAIAAYLAGIKTSEKVRLMTDYVAAALKNNKNNVTFANWHATPSCLGRHGHDVEALYYVAGSQGPSGQARVSGRYYGWTIFKNDDVYVRGSYIKYPWGADDKNESYQNYMYWGYFVDRKNIEKGWYLYDTNMHRCKITLQCDAANFDNGELGTPTMYANASSTRTLTSDFLTRLRPGKVKEEKEMTIMTNQKIKMPLWMSHTWSYPELTIASGVSKSSGTTKEKENSKTKQDWMAYMNGSYVATKSMLMCEYDFKDEYPDYDAKEYPDKTKNEEFDIQIQKTKESTGTVQSVTGVQQKWWRQVTAQSSLSGSSNNVKFMWKYRKQKKYNMDSYKIVSKYWNDITQLEESHYAYNGIVIARVNKPGTAKFSFNVVADTKNSKTKYTYAISDRPFKNGLISDKDIDGTGKDAYNHILKYGKNVNLGKIEIEIKKEKIFNKSDGDFLYLKISPDTLKHVVHVESTLAPTYVTE